MAQKIRKDTRARKGTTTSKYKRLEALIDRGFAGGFVTTDTATNQHTQRFIPDVPFVVSACAFSWLKSATLTGRVPARA
jgi:hypothetical protein